MAKERRVIEIRVATNEKQLKKLSDQFDRFDKRLKRTNKSLGGFGNVFKTFIAGIGVREIVRAADEFQLFEDRIAVFTGSTEKAAEVTMDLAEAARLTRTSVASLGEVYNRVALATSDLGLNSEQIIATTVALQQSFRLSGATMAEATGATIQLTQGLASGQLRGQELRSVLESNAVIGKILADQFGITRGELIKFAEQGKFTSDVVLKALAENFDDLNERAGKLGTTFGQSLIILFDAFKLKINELNKEFGASAKFAKGIEFIIKNFDDIFDVLSKVIGAGLFVKAAFGVNALITALSSGALFAAINPIVAATAAIAGLVVILAKVNEPTKYENLVQLQNNLERSEKIVGRLRKRIGELSQGEKDFDKAAENAEKRGAFQKDLNDALTKQKEIRAEIKSLLKDGGKETSLIDRLKKSYEELNLSGNKAKLTLKALNNQYNAGIITLDEYKNKLIELEKLEITEKFNEGKISLQEFNKEMFILKEQMGQVSAQSSVFEGISQGVMSVAENAKTLSQEVAAATTQAFGHVEDAIFNAAKGSKTSFAEATQAILDDLTRIIIRTQIVNNLASGISGAFSGGGGGVTANANGNVFTNGSVTPFANGGVVGSPTYFPMSNGTGLMGEAGPEAIIPLERTSDGKLGVNANTTPVNVIINNQAGGNVETSESTGPNGEKQIEVLITDAVKKGFSQGKFDKTMSNQFGVNRRGR